MSTTAGRTAMPKYVRNSNFSSCSLRREPLQRVYVVYVFQQWKDICVTFLFLLPLVALGLSAVVPRRHSPVSSLSRAGKQRLELSEPSRGKRANILIWRNERRSVRFYVRTRLASEKKTMKIEFWKQPIWKWNSGISLMYETHWPMSESEFERMFNELFPKDGPAAWRSWVVGIVEEPVGGRSSGVRVSGLAELRRRKAMEGSINLSG